MKQILVIFIFVLFHQVIYSQFQGEIVYKIEMKNKVLDKLIKDKTYAELRESNVFYDTLKVLIKNDNFITVKNDNFETTSILIEKDKKEFTISKNLLPRDGTKLLYTIDLENNLMYNKDNFENYNNVKVSDTIINSKMYKKYILQDSMITEIFIISDKPMETAIVKNYLLSPYTGQNLNSEHYKPFRNKIIYYYEMKFGDFKWIMQLVKIEERDIADNLFKIPKTNKRGVFK